MTAPKLTGLEYYWFGQSQLVVSHYAQYWDAELDPAVADVVLLIRNDAEACYTGPQSLQRLAERLNNEAADISMTAAASGASENNLKQDNRRITAMRCLSSRFLASADELYKLKHRK
jgi:hypothetical protein